MSKSTVSDLKTKLNTARKTLRELQEQVSTLSGMKEEALNKLSTLGAQVRAGKLSIDELLKAQADSNTKDALYNHHQIEIEAVQSEVETLSAELARSEDLTRLQELEQSFNTNTLKRIEAEKSFVKAVRGGLVEMLNIANTLCDEAREIQAIRDHHGVKCSDADEARHLASRHYPELVVLDDLKYRSQTFRDESEAFRTFLRIGGIERLLRELQADLGHATS